MQRVVVEMAVAAILELDLDDDSHRRWILSPVSIRRILKMEPGFLTVLISTDRGWVKRFAGANLPGFTIEHVFETPSEVFLIVKGSLSPKLEPLDKARDVFIDMPIAVNNGVVRVPLLGELERITDILTALKKNGISYKIVSCRPMSTQTGSVLDSLPNVQRKVIMTAIKMGYYDIPRRVKVKEIAAALKKHPATVQEHLRKAEREIIRLVLE